VFCTWNSCRFQQVFGSFEKWAPRHKMWTVPIVLSWGLGTKCGRRLSCFAIGCWLYWVDWPSTNRFSNAHENSWLDTLLVYSSADLRVLLYLSYSVFSHHKKNTTNNKAGKSIACVLDLPRVVVKFLAGLVTDIFAWSNYVVAFRNCLPSTLG